MTFKFPKVPFIYIHRNKNYHFMINGKRYGQTQEDHGLFNHSDIIELAKKHAMVVYYNFYHEQQLLPDILVENQGNGFSFIYQLSDTKFVASQMIYKTYDDAFEEAIKSLLINKNIKGVR